MPSGTGRWRWQANREMYDQFARSAPVGALLTGIAERGAGAAQGFAPEYSGPTYNPAVKRSGEYKASIYSAATLRPNGWRAEFGATAPWTLQVEFGTGRPGTTDSRPQGGWSPKFRVLGRALDTLRST